MSDIKIQPSATGSATVTLTAPATGTARTVTLPDGTGTLIADDGSGNIDVTGVGKFSLDNNGGAGGGIVASNTNASNPALGGYVDLMERGTAFGTANNYGVRLYYDGNANKFHIQGGDQTTVATHLTMVRDSGDITIDTGDLIFGTAGKGIVLGSTSNTNANTLDDYEEGTWTPVFQAGGSNITASYNSSQHKASYIKVGKMVTIFLQTRTDSISGSPSGNIQIAGLPFNKAGDGAAGGHCGDAYHWNNNHPIAFTVNGDTIGLNRPDANKTAITSSDLRTSNDSNQLFVSFTYRIA